MLSKNRNKGNAELAAGIGCVGSAVVFGLAAFAAYCTHLGWLFGTFMDDKGVTGGQFFLAVVGTLFPPAGIFHGIYIWFS